tara:strand:- start:405 stop:977 length:573 start_codon:yes stop_codon:yes gene_type:complete
MEYVTPTKASKILGVCTRTLKNWEEKGKIEVYRTPTGHRRYKVQTDKVSQKKKKQKPTKYIYARVSSKKQQKHLQNQIDALKQKYPKHTVISDIGSGLNYKRKGFKRILDQLYERDIQEIVVASKDRLVRFGYEFFEHTFEKFGARIICENSKGQDPDRELAEDILAITTVFSARIHGSRKYKTTDAELS